MSEITSSDRKDKQPFVEDGSDSDRDVKPKGKDHPLKTVPSNASANSASKRSSKAAKVHQDEKPRESKSGQKDRHISSDKPVSPKKSRHAPSSDPGATKQPSSSRSHSKRTARLHSPEKSLSKGDRAHNPEKAHKRDGTDVKGPCDCPKCAAWRAYYGRQRPGPAPLQHSYHAYTQAHPGYSPHVPPPNMYPPHHVGPNVPFAPGQHQAIHSDPRRNSYYPGMQLAPAPAGAPFLVHPRMPPQPRGHDPNFLPSHSMAPPPLTTRAPPSPTRPSRPSFDQTESYSTRISNPQYAPKLRDEFEDDSPGHAYEEEESFNTRYIPQGRHMPGEFEAPDDYYDSLPESPPSPVRMTRGSRQQYVAAPMPEPRDDMHRRSRSDLIRNGYPEQLRDPRPEHPQEYFERNDRRIPRRAELGYDDYDRDPSTHAQLAYRPGFSRRDSISSGRTHSTFYSNPEDQYDRRDSYAPRPRHVTAEEAARAYQIQARGGPEELVTAETLRHIGGGPRSNISQHSHRSRNSMSETSSRLRAGSVKVLLPITAAEGTTIELSGDGPERFSIRATEDRNQVELTIGTSGRESKYYASNTSAGRSAAPTRSSGSTRRSRAESSDVRRERDPREGRRSSRAPSSRKGTI